MSFQQKNVAVSLGTFTVILGSYLIRLLQMIQGDSFIAANVFRLWAIVIVLAVVATILMTILTHIVANIVEAVRTKGEPELEEFADERDKLIDLKGTRVTYAVSSVGALVAMLTFALGQPPLVMFALLIFFALLAQIVGDVSRLTFYRRGF